jgi:hypothetical protein
MQQDISLDIEETEYLPQSVWALLMIGLLPHALAMLGAQSMGMLSSYVCFPISMGPFACLHAYLLCTRMDCSCRFAWISVLLLSLLWFSILWWQWRKNAGRTVALGIILSVISAAVIYWRIMPPV